MPDRPPPAPSTLSDVALRETLDLLGQVVASMSARIDWQGKQIEAMAKAVEKTRSVTKRTEQQTDPAAYARFIGTEVETALDGVLDQFAAAIRAIRSDHETTLMLGRRGCAAVMTRERYAHRASSRRKSAA